MSCLAIVEPYGNYCARMAEEQAAERADAGTEAPVDYELVLLCVECRGTGRREMQTGGYWADFVAEDCPFCRGTGAAAIYPIGVGFGVPPAA